MTINKLNVHPRKLIKSKGRKMKSKIDFNHSKNILELQSYAHLTLTCVKCMCIILVLFLVIDISFLAIVG